MKKQKYIIKIGAVSVALLALMSAPKAEELNTMEIVIKDKVYAVELVENQTTDALKKMLPLTIDTTYFFIFILFKPKSANFSK